MSDNPFSVRVAEPSDRPALIEIAILIISEGALQTVSADCVADMVDRCIARDRAIAGIIEGAMGIEASIGIIVDRFDYSDEDHLDAKWLGVAPNYRTSNHGAKLLSFARWFQEGVGIPLFLELLTVRELQAKMHLYSRTLPQVGAQYSFGGAPEGQFNQGRVGDDPHGRRGKLLKKAKHGHERRTPVSSQAA